LSVVYTELLDFDGDEIYFHDEPGLSGKSFRDAIMSYEESTIIGLAFGDGKIQVNPPMDTVIKSGDKIIAISRDDDTIKLTGNSENQIDYSFFSKGEGKQPEVEHTLILGWNCRAAAIISELDNYLAPGSTLTACSETAQTETELKVLQNRLKNQTLRYIPGNICDRNLLDSLELYKFSHIILLCYSDAMPEAEADSKTLITLLHLRNIEQLTGYDFSIVSEMLDIRNKELAEVTEADDFIISNKLISLMLSQLSENKQLKAVFDDLFDAEGSEIYVKPVTNYIKGNTSVNFYTMCAAAAEKGEIAIGYRVNKFSHNPEKVYGVVVNPKKSETITFTAKDKLIVIAED
jgi:hypothetical protein